MGFEGVTIHAVFARGTTATAAAMPMEQGDAASAAEVDAIQQILEFGLTTDPAVALSALRAAGGDANASVERLLLQQAAGGAAPLGYADDSALDRMSSAERVAMAMALSEGASPHAAPSPNPAGMAAQAAARREADSKGGGDGEGSGDDGQGAVGAAGLLLESREIEAVRQVRQQQATANAALWAELTAANRGNCPALHPPVVRPIALAECRSARQSDSHWLSTLTLAESAA